MAKYSKQIVDAICNYIKDGDSQKLACKKVGIAESTLYEWINKKSELSKHIKKAREEFRETITGKLEASLWKRAMGYEVTETETEYVSDAKGNPKIKSQKTKVKHIQPDTGALIFALTNVAPERWVNKQKIETRELRKEEEVGNNYHFEDIPDDLIIDIAQKIQDADFEKRRLENEEKKPNK